MPAYLPEGNNQDHRRSPSPHGYSAREVATLYPHRYGYNIAGAFGHADPGVAARIASKSCRCQHQCSCNSESKTTQKVQQQQQQLEGSSSESPPAMWHSKDGNMTVDRRQGLFHGETTGDARSVEAPPTAVSVSAPSRSPSPSAVLPHQQQPRDEHHVMPTVELTSSASKKSDWENLLGAVDLELRAQQRAELVPDSAPTHALPSHHYAHAINAAHHHHQLQHQQEQHHHHHRQHHQLHQQQSRAPLHPSSIGGDNRYTQSAASVSPDFGPIKTTAARHHRRGGGGAADDISGGGAPAYSGSTADAACLLATLPQRMLDRASMVSKHSSNHHHHNHPTASPTGAVGVALPAPRPPQAVLVSAASPPVTPVRVQASGRRGPRGQSRFKGVCITRAGKWRAVIYIGRKQKYLGVFDSEFDAARAYDAAALQHFAEGAKLNFPDGIERQLNEISSVSGRPFATAGAGGAVAPRSSTPPVYVDTASGAAAAAAAAGSSPSSATGGKRSRKSAFGDDDGDEWVREDGPWNPSRR